MLCVEYSVVLTLRCICATLRCLQGDAGKKKKIKYVYKTADELLKEGPVRKKGRGEQSTLSKVKVIDMTGREQRVLSGWWLALESLLINRFMLVLADVTLTDFYALM